MINLTESAIFVTFYYADDDQQTAEAKSKPLVDYLTDDSQFGLKQDQDHPEQWYHDDYQLKIRFRLHWFTPTIPHAADTRLVQLVLSDLVAGRHAVEGWQAMRAELERVINKDRSHDQLKGIFGYTIFYQAVTPNDEPIPTIDFPSYASILKPIHRSTTLLLAESTVLNSQAKLWLLNIPTHLDTPMPGDHLAKGTIYLALSPKSLNNSLINQIIYGQQSTMFMPELIAHKAYQEIRQYRLYDEQKQITVTMRQIMGQAVTRLESLNQNSDISGVTDQYSQLFGQYTQLERAYISLTRQSYNFDLWKEQANAPEIISFHERQIKTRIKELELKIKEGQSVLQAANTAVTIIQTRLERRIEYLLVAIGIALAVPQLIDPEAAAALLSLANYPPPRQSNIAV